MSARFVPGTAPVLGVDALWIGIRGMDVLVLDRGDHDELPVAPRAGGARDHGRSARSTWASSTACRAARPSSPDDHEAPPGMAFRSLRELYSRIDEQLWTLAGRAAQLVSGTSRTSTADAAARRPSMRRASAPAAAPSAATRRSRAYRRP